MVNPGSSSSSSSLPTPPQFQGDNYDYWAVRIKVFFIANGLWELVSDGFTEPDDLGTLTVQQMKTHKENVQKHNMAISYLHSLVSPSIFPMIVSCGSAKEAWDVLQQEFQGSEKTRAIRLQTLRREFETLKMKETETIKEYAVRVQENVNQMRLYGEKLSDLRIVEKILITVTEKFDAKVAAIEESKDIDKLTVTELLGSLQAHEQRLKMKTEEYEETALQIKTMKKNFSREGANKDVQERSPEKFKETLSKPTQGSFSPCKYCQRTSHPEQRCWKIKRCNLCKKIGHIQRFCKLKQNSAKEEEHTMNKANVDICTRQNQEAKQAAVEGEFLFMAGNFLNEPSKGVWYVDSGCTSHMSPDITVFSELDKTVRIPVRVANGVLVESAGRGTVKIHTEQGTKFIRNVLFVPDLNHNLLSVSQMVKNGYSVAFNSELCTIRDPNGNIVAEIYMENNCFPIRTLKTGEMSLASQQDESKLWHKRCGHINMVSLKNAAQQELVKDLPAISDFKGVCEACQLGKQRRLSFPSSTQRAKEKLELVHSDVCGPMRKPSLSKNVYFVLFIDDCTRMTWIYFMQHKAEVFKLFKNFLAMAENQSGCKLRTLRSDRGGEYTSVEFKRFCEDKGINRQLTVPYSPQQNGVSERKNRTIMEMVRCLMTEKNLPGEFWAEAAYTAVYLLNRLPSKALANQTPIEAWTGNKPSAKHLKIFGSVCYVHIPSQQRTKLEAKAMKGIFLGYSNQSKGYRVYIVESGKVITTRDVKVDEGARWNFEKQDAELIEKTNMQPMQDLLTEEENIEQQLREENYDSDTPPTRFRSLADVYERCSEMIEEPTSFDEAKRNKDWVQAMEEEIRMIEKNDTWVLVERPIDKNVIGVKWIFKKKFNADGTINKLKARLVVKGYAQEPGIDFSETFAPVARLDTIRCILAVAAQKGWTVYQLDIKSAFLNGVVEEEIYVEQPDGFEREDRSKNVYRLNKALYGLKQAPRAWYSQIDSYLTDSGFKRSENEATLYLSTGMEEKVIISIYVDDILITGKSKEKIVEFIANMESHFEMTNLGAMKYFLGMEIKQLSQGFFLSQKLFAENMLKKFNMESCKPVNTPIVLAGKINKEDDFKQTDPKVYRSIVGSLLYLTATRPDIMFAASYLSRFMHNPGEAHLVAAKRTLRYIRGTVNLGIWLPTEFNCILTVYSDSDWAGDVDMKSTSGYACLLGGGLFSWNSKKQSTVAQSTAEAEYIAASLATNHAIWIRRILEDLGEEQKEATQILVDNKSAIAITKNPVFHGRTKHINVKYHAIREAEKLKAVCVNYCRGEEQLADIFTKSLHKGRFDDLKLLLGIKECTVQGEC